jgi:hypothetical protein
MSFDSASRARLRTLYPDLAVRAFRFEQDVTNHVGLQIKVTEAIRTLAYQAQLYARGRQWTPMVGPPLPPGTVPMEKSPAGVWHVVDKRLVVTNAPAGSSIHHYGLALDIAFAGSDPYLEAIRKANLSHWDEIWRKVGTLAQGHGLVWGYDWNGNGKVDGNDFDRPHFQITYGLSLSQIQELYRHGGMAAVWAQCDRIRQVEQGSEWDGILTKRRLLEAGILA